MQLQMRLERKKRGLSCNQVGMLVGTTAETIRLIEIGKRKPSYEVLLKLEDLFQMNHRDLFAEANGSENQTVKK